MAEIGRKQDSADKAAAEPQCRHAQREAAARGMADQDAAGRRASAIELVQKIRQVIFELTDIGDIAAGA